MTGRAVIAIALAGALGSACMLHRKSPGSGPAVGQNDPVGAAVFAGSAVGAVAVNRALTRECYSSCPYGTVCDHEKGTCERIACSCPADRVCEKIGGETVCVGKPVLHTGRDAGSGDGGGAGAVYGPEPIGDASVRD